MKKVTFSFLSILLVGAFIFPQGAQALSALQIESILGLLRAFDADSSTVNAVSNTLQGNTGVSTSSIEYKDTLQLSRNLSRGMKGGDVERLQRYLRSTGDYKEDVTGYYGVRTEEAVKSWQSRTGVVRSGTPSTTGYGNVGPSTRTALTNAARTAVVVTPNVPDETRGVDTVTLVTPQLPDETGGVDTFTPVTPQLPDETGGVETGNIDAGAKFAATPTLGDAPLTVTFSTNLEQFSGLQGGGSIQLDYGDGNVIILCKPGVSGVSACTQEWSSSTYTYRQEGLYNAKLLRQPDSGSSSVLGTVSITVGTPTPDVRVPDERPGVETVPPIKLSLTAAPSTKVSKGDHVVFTWISEEARECTGTFSDGHRGSYDGLSVSIGRYLDESVTLTVLCTNGAVRNSQSISVEVEQKAVEPVPVLILGKSIRATEPEIINDPIKGHLMYFVTGNAEIGVAKNCPNDLNECKDTEIVITKSDSGLKVLRSPSIVKMGDTANGGREYYIMYMSGSEEESFADSIYYSTSWVGDGINWSKPQLLLSGYVDPGAVRDFGENFSQSQEAKGEVLLFSNEKSGRKNIYLHRLGLSGVATSTPELVSLPVPEGARSGNYAHPDIRLGCEKVCYYVLHATYFHNPVGNSTIESLYSYGSGAPTSLSSWRKWSDSMLPEEGEDVIYAPTKRNLKYPDNRLFYTNNFEGGIYTRALPSERSSVAQAFINSIQSAVNKGFASIANVFGSLFGN